MRKTLITLIVSSILLVGCGTKQIEYQNREVLNHPEWPKPITERKFDIKVVVVNGESIIGMNYEDNIEFQIYQEDILRYVKDMKAMICFYRSSIKDPNCAEQEGAKKAP